ncbi:MAG: 3-dehydroquinate synthase [Planctomyces sp.]|nr:3-dehydroquinate synthase [Planctomyces sp.]
MRIEAPFTCTWTHRLCFTSGVLDPANPTLRDALEPTADGPARAQFYVDSGVAAAWPGLADRVAHYAQRSAGRLELAGPTVIVPGGEECKNDRAQLDRLLQTMAAARLCRRSYAIALGGGAVLDAVGLAAALTHRGVRLVRLPTTTLAQDDSGVGVKNAVNAFGKKNFLGVFAPPWAVINDAEFLTTLSDRDWRSGFSEAVKVALIKDGAEFGRIEAAAEAIARRDADAAGPVIRRSAELHLRHITRGGDPFETDSARPLDFGHWAAHKLEALTGFALRHGEAVAIGVAVDAAYSALIGLAPEADARRAAGCLRALGFALEHPALGDADAVLGGLEEFREHLGGRLTVTLLGGIGRGVDVHAIDARAMRRAIEQVAAGRWAQCQRTVAARDPAGASHASQQRAVTRGPSAGPAHAGPEAVGHVVQAEDR